MSRCKILIPVLVGAVALVSVAATLTDPGLSWDECIYLGFAETYINWLKGAPPPAALAHLFGHPWDEGAWHDHPPLALFWMGAFVAVRKWWLAIPAYYTLTIAELYAARFAVAVAFTALVLGVYALGSWGYGRRAGVLGAVALMILPRVFAHAHFGTLEIFTCLMWVLTTLCFVKGIESKRWAGVTGMVLGLALLTKIQLVFLPPALLLWGALYHRKKVLPNLIAMAAIAPLVFVIGWPWLYANPIGRLIQYAHDLTQRAPVPLYYLGKLYNWEGHPGAPAHYPLVMMLVTVPLGLLVAFIWQLVSAIKHIKKHPALGLLVISLGTILVTSSLPGVPKHDGVRLFLHLFVFVACLAGIALDVLWKWIEKRWGQVKAAAVIAILMLTQAVPMVLTHPFGLGYYNALVGSIPGAHKLGFESIYWGESVDGKVLDYLNQNAPDGSRVVFYPIGGFVPRYLKQWGELKESLVVVSNPEEALRTGEYDYAVLVARLSFLKLHPEAWKMFQEQEPVFQRTLLGVPVCKVFARLPQP